MQLQPLQRANAHCSVARAMVELFVVYLRTQGLASKEHPINKDAVRYCILSGGPAFMALQTGVYAARRICACGRNKATLVPVAKSAAKYRL